MFWNMQRYNCTFIPAGVPFAPFVVNVQSTYSPDALTDVGQADLAGLGVPLGLADAVFTGVIVFTATAVGNGLTVRTGIAVATGLIVATPGRTVDALITTPV
jgi:hypothetical protein